MRQFTVAILEKGYDKGEETVGSVWTDDVEVGQTVTVDLKDENGNPITATGIVTEVLDVEDF